MSPPEGITMPPRYQRVSEYDEDDIDDDTSRRKRPTCSTVLTLLVNLLSQGRPFRRVNIN